MPFDSNGPIVVWFRSDLRINDHPALHAAFKTNAPVIPVYILNQEPKMGRASLWWLEGSLVALKKSLEAINSRLILRRGEPLEILHNIIKFSGAKAIYFSRCYEPASVKQEKNLASFLNKKKIECRRFSGSLLIEPEMVKSKSGNAFKVFTPFYNACLNMGIIKEPIPAPRILVAPDEWPKSDKLESWRLRPSEPNWAAEFSRYWSPGSIGAQSRLKDFISSKIYDYDKYRDRPDRNGTSALSPYLHFGELSPREVYNIVCSANKLDDNSFLGGKAYLRELFWREFSYHLLYHWPKIVESNFKNFFDSFPWRDDEECFHAWKVGMTGYPIVDAGMRQLWKTGWMHNRVRMIVASFLTKHLLISWEKGASWFWDTLVDADLANNSASWQWVAGCGADAAPYFRIFNPIIQGEKFDPEGDYVREWVPEIYRLSNKFIHKPWENPTNVANYPEPIVDHRVARQRALNAYQSIRR